MRRADSIVNGEHSAGLDGVDLEALPAERRHLERGGHARLPALICERVSRLRGVELADGDAADIDVRQVRAALRYLIARENSAADDRQQQDEYQPQRCAAALFPLLFLHLGRAELRLRAAGFVIYMLLCGSVAILLIVPGFVHFKFISFAAHFLSAHMLPLPDVSF